MELIYVDTNIFIDFWEDRGNGVWPLGEFAFQLLKETYGCKFKVVLSSAVMDELLFNYDRETVDKMLKDLRGSEKYFYTEAGGDDRAYARRLVEERETGFNDTLHAVLANRHKARYLVTHNTRHFEKLSDLIEAKHPADLLGPLRGVG